MSIEREPTKIPAWLTALLVVMLVLLGTQSLVLFNVWRNLPADRSRSGTTAFAKNAETDSFFQAQKHGANDPFGDLDSLGRNFDKDDWNPFDEFRHMREQMDSLFDDSFGRFSLTTPGTKRGAHAFTFSPNLDLQEKDDSYIARMDIPGADKNNLSVNLEDRELIVSGQISESTEKKDGDQVLRKERRSGSFKRSLTLPGPVAANKLDARYDNGVLTITIPKAKEDKQSKPIQVK